jgi:hypothetical protein
MLARGKPVAGIIQYQEGKLTDLSKSMMLLPRESSYVGSTSYSLGCSSRAVSSAKSPSGCQSHREDPTPAGGQRRSGNGAKSGRSS